MQASALFDLTGRVALVTGGGTGIGLMIAQGLAANGAKVYITGRREHVLTKSAQTSEGKGQLVPLTMDVTDKASILSAKEMVFSNDGFLDILVNNAGQDDPGSVWMSDESDVKNKEPEAFGLGLFDERQEDWSNIFSIIGYSCFFVTSAFLGLLAKGSERHGAYSANVINVTSVCASIEVAMNHFGYNSAKAAATHITKMFATELARRKIPVRVNTLAPGLFESEMTAEKLAENGIEGVTLGVQPLPHARVGGANEMAGTALWMASLAGGYLNGQEIMIDGGYTAVNPSRSRLYGPRENAVPCHSPWRLEIYLYVDSFS